MSPAAASGSSASLEQTLERVEREDGARFGDRRLTTFALLGMVNHLPQWYRPRGRLDTDEIARGFCDMVLGAPSAVTSQVSDRPPDASFKVAAMATTAITNDTRAGVGPLLRDWRRRRRLSQLDLALEAGISARHLSFVETGRSKPSAEMVLRLAEQLDVPLRERNQLLLAGGYAPAYEERDLEAPELAPVHDAIQRVLDGHDPYPALVVDRHWNLLAGNHSVAVLTAGVAPELLRPPANAMRLALHPDGLAPRIVNHGEWRAHLLERLARQVAVTSDARLQALLEEVAAYSAPDDDAGGPAGGRRPRPRRADRGAAAVAHGRRSAQPDLDRLDLRHGDRHHRRGAVDRGLLPGRRAERGAAARAGRRVAPPAHVPFMLAAYARRR